MLQKGVGGHRHEHASVQALARIALRRDRGRALPSSADGPARKPGAP